MQLRALLPPQSNDYGILAISAVKDKVHFHVARNEHVIMGEEVQSSELIFHKQDMAQIAQWGNTLSVKRCWIRGTF